MPFGVRVRHVVEPQEVAASQLDRVDAHLARRDLEHDLPGERLVLPRPPVAGTAGGVRVDGAQPEPGGGHPVRPGEDDADHHRRHRRPRASGTRRRRTGSRGARPGSGPRRRRPCGRSPCSWRDQPAAIRFSRRSSIHFTAAGSFVAASMTHISSRCTRIFWPKPPPVSRAMARTRCSGIPSRRAQNARCSCGACVATHIVISPVLGSCSTTMPAGLDRHRGVRLLVDRALRRRASAAANTGFERARTARRRRG